MPVAISASEQWKEAHPRALVGVLEVSGVDNRAPCPGLDGRKRKVEAALRERYRGFSRSDFVAAPVLADYVRYYKSFEKTYHVQLQLESIVLKGKPLPRVSPLVDANFVAEVQTLVLTAGHDAERLQQPLRIDVSGDGDTIVQMNGTMRPLRPGDMIMRDAGGISCSILYGQDNRSPISADTTRALYVAYAPADVPAAAVNAQLDAILDNIRTFAPQCALEQRLLLRGSA
jgi:DNA/RNA-binding domain of Phe-tRNA-synthetase-like protein